MLQVHFLQGSYYHPFQITSQRLWLSSGVFLTITPVMNRSRKLGALVCSDERTSKQDCCLHALRSSLLLLLCWGCMRPLHIAFNCVLPVMRKGVFSACG